VKPRKYEKQAFVLSNWHNWQPFAKGYYLLLRQINVMLKIGVLGAGHLGKIHLNCIAQIDGFELCGFYDSDPVMAAEVSESHNLRHFSCPEALIEAVDVVDIVTPTISHYASAAKALRSFKHVFIEKPVVATTAEARSLLDLAREANVKVQVGHVERFNPAFIAAMPYIDQPMFIEAHRLSTFNQRGTDVPVVLDLMIHDIDIILHIVKANIRKISASGVSVISSSPDIASARLEFDNGCVANLTASRISLKNLRKARLFQKDTYISIDYLNKETEVIRLNDTKGSPDSWSIFLEPGPDQAAREIRIEKPIIHPINAIQSELESFLKAITEDGQPPVTIDDGCQALEIANQILARMNR
jgi:predicted dehydrogenase